jgi:rubrerythrin
MCDEGLMQRITNRVIALEDTTAYLKTTLLEGRLDKSKYKHITYGVWCCGSCDTEYGLGVLPKYCPECGHRR